jgi:hypothetical protein
VRDRHNDALRGHIRADASAEERYREFEVRINRYIYWVAATDRAYGEGDARRIELLRALWQSYRLVEAIGPFDGASFWIADGQPQARIIRATHVTAPHAVEVVDVAPSPCL